MNPLPPLRATRGPSRSFLRRGPTGVALPLLALAPATFAASKPYQPDWSSLKIVPRK